MYRLFNSLSQFIANQNHNHIHNHFLLGNFLVGRDNNREYILHTLVRLQVAVRPLSEPGALDALQVGAEEPWVDLLSS